MGKWIDRIVGWTAAIVVLYVFFYRCFQSARIASALDFFCCMLILRAVRGRTPRFSMSAAQAQTILNQWICESDDEARRQILNLTGCKKPLVYLPKAPMSVLSAADLFGLWKQHRGASEIAAAALCPAEQSAKIFAQNCRMPAIEIYDAPRLTEMIRTSSLMPPSRPPAVPFRKRFSLRTLCGRYSWKKHGVSGLFLVAVYLHTGNLLYLILGTVSLFLCGAALRIRSESA